MKNTFKVLLIILFAWKLADAELAAESGAHDSVWAAQVSPGGHYMALGCRFDGEVAVCLRDTAGGAATKVEFAPAGTRLSGFYWASDHHLIQVFEIAANPAAEPPIVSGPVYRLLSHNMKTGAAVLLLAGSPTSGASVRMEAICDTAPEKVIVSRSRPIRHVSDTEPIGEQLFIVDLNSGDAQPHPSHAVTHLQTLFGRDCQSMVETHYLPQARRFVMRAAQTGDTLFAMDDTDLPMLELAGLNAARDGVILRVLGQDEAKHYLLRISDRSIRPIIGFGTAETPLRDYFSEIVIGFSQSGERRVHTYIDPQLRAIQEQAETVFASSNVLITSFTRDRRTATLLLRFLGRPDRHMLYRSDRDQYVDLGTVADPAQPALTGEEDAIQPAS